MINHWNHGKCMCSSSTKWDNIAHGFSYAKYVYLARERWHFGKLIVICNPLSPIFRAIFQSNRAQSSSVASFLVWGGGGGKTPKCTDKKIYVLILCERAPQKHIFSGLKIHLHTYTINAVSFNYLCYGIINDIIPSEHYASELRIFLAFSHSKTAISFNILLVLLHT